LFSYLANAQVQFPNVSTNATGSAERVSSFTVNGAGNDRLEITNATDSEGQFVPTLWAYRNTDNRHVLGITASIPSTIDNGTTPLMIFSTSLANSIQLGAPSNGVFPWGNVGTTQNIANRPLFQWRNNSLRIMTISSIGNVGIGTESPTTRFHTNGSLRFENLPTVTTNNFVLKTDLNGVVSRQLSNSFGDSGVGNSCGIPNFLTKNGNIDLTCSQVFDNGTNVGINTTTPSAKFHINGTVRLENLPNTSSNNFIITSDNNRNLSKQLASFGNVNSNCFSNNYVAKNNGTGLTCSQIYDNGTSIGFGTNTNFTYNTNGLATTTTTGFTTGTLKLNIAGVSRGNVFISTSDQSYKLNLNPIEDALDKIIKLKGVTYNWNTVNFPEMNFDETDHSGLIAQQVEEILPHLVYTIIDDERDPKGKKSVNYIELIPYLIEAIKTQQLQIQDLQQQVISNFARQNNELINFKNTKIISVSPNPSSENVYISLNIEDGIQDAKLVIYDLKGTLLNSLIVKERQYNIVKSLQKDNFGTGIYIVSLLINGKNIDSKKVVFN
jgi:hypothetical protein